MDEEAGDAAVLRTRALQIQILEFMTRALWSQAKEKSYPVGKPRRSVLEYPIIKQQEAVNKH